MGSTIDSSADSSETSNEERTHNSAAGSSRASFRWRDRTIWRIGVKGGWPVDIVEQEGTGVWAIDMADSFPHVDVFGIDEMAKQPVMVPPNCETSLFKTIPFRATSFDLIHLRFLAHRLASYQDLVLRCLNLLAPGGLFLIFDNFTLPQDTDDWVPQGVQAFHDAFDRSSSTAGIARVGVEEVVHTLRSAVNAGSGGGERMGQEHKEIRLRKWCGEIKGDFIKVPIGHGDGRMSQLAKIHLINLKAWIESTRYMIVECGGYTDAEFEVLSEAYFREVETRELYTCYHSLWVRKGQ
uniref:Methyltransferase type 11 domain-containing protein n=1 Tax=Kwoniella dejecticola CBS 10117 TaxID=1296121 RepID=A0A1A6A1S1_9TREE|nr:uncharacterized protein I303_06291 [Kwoniella dejecticola CBS 10117]OBR84004.1 hypothetical protein I303_06291 [Kwoniella dejecticola CBS 10117]